MKMQLLKTIAVILLVAGVGSQVSANKLGADIGFFNLQAKTNSREGQVSTVGSYRLLYGYPIYPQFDLNLGYSLIMSNTIGGDMGFGFDLGFAYFPLTASAPMSTTVVNATSYTIEEMWRPYVAGTFHQRQFQSVQSNYAGFGIAVGSERAFRDRISLKGEVRYMMLYGPVSATANQLDVLVGIVIH